MKTISELEGDWLVIQGKLKQKFANLTDDDLLLIEGKHDETFGRLQVRLSKTREELKELISRL